MTTRARTQPLGTRPRRSRFERLADWAYSHRRQALLAWVAALVGVTAASSAVGSDYHNDFSLPGTESQKAVETLQARAPARAGDTVQVVFRWLRRRVTDVALERA